MIKKVKLFDGTEIQVVKKALIYGKEYTVVGFSEDVIVLANLNHEAVDDARVLQYTENEIEELTSDGIIKNY